MEFFYECVTCLHYRRDAPAGTPSLPDQNRWCAKHQRKLPKETCSVQLICSDFCHQDSRANEWQSVISKFPDGELWTFELYRPSRKFAVIADLPGVDPETGNLVES